MNGKGYGMPSSHAQFLALFFLSLSLFLLLRHRAPPSPKDHSHQSYPQQPLTLPTRALSSPLTLSFAATVAASRIYLNYHSPIQVTVGCRAGTVSVVVWFGITE